MVGRKFYGGKEVSSWEGSLIEGKKLPSEMEASRSEVNLPMERMYPSGKYASR
jgi:hypothetical protein